MTKDFDHIITNFLVRFNQMCTTERKDFLIRERWATYESGKKLERYNVSYRLKSSLDKWKVEAVTKGFWIFRKKFPLLEITRKKGIVNFSGMFTYSIPDFNENELEKKLEEYLAICKSVPQDVFIKS